MKNLLRIQTLLLILLTFSSVCSFAQDNTEIDDTGKEVSKACDPETVFMIIEEPPVYKGGIEQLEHDLNAAISFKKKVKEEVFFKWTTNCKGEIFGIQDPRNTESEAWKKIAAELLKLQNWEAGKQNGIPLDCFYNLPLEIKKGKIQCHSKLRKK